MKYRVNAILEDRRLESDDAKTVQQILQCHFEDCDYKVHSLVINVVKG